MHTCDVRCWARTAAEHVLVSGVHTHWGPLHFLFLLIITHKSSMNLGTAGEKDIPAQGGCIQWGMRRG